jgi:molybdopterin converting factor small subunit
MSITVKISPLLRKYTNGKESVKVKGHSPMECLHALEAKYPDLKRLLYDKQGKLVPMVMFFVNDQRIHADELNNTLKDGDELLISLAIGGA